MVARKRLFIANFKPNLLGESGAAAGGEPVGEMPVSPREELGFGSQLRLEL